VKEAVKQAWEPFNRPLEGRVHWMYLDVKGLVSTGVGNLIDATKTPLTQPDATERARSHEIARRLPWQVGVDGEFASDQEIDNAWDVVKSRMDLAPRGGGIFVDITELRISDEAIDHLVETRLAEMASFLKGRTMLIDGSRVAPFGDFDSWPADAQLGLLSMAWGMGPAFNFPKFQHAAFARDWLTAADECRFNPEVGTIVTRNDHNQKLFRNAFRVEDEGLDPEVLLFPVP
jgi:hypothetical protein